jgi:hydrogenase maturation protease
VAEHRHAPVLVIGLGNDLRADDGAGVAVARRLRQGPLPDEVEVREEQGEPIGLLDRWPGRDAVLIVDTMRSGAPPGTIRRLDVTRRPLPRAARETGSTHAIALGEAIELARALDRLPPRVVVHAVEGRRFHIGRELSAEVRAVIPALAAAVLRDARALAARRPPSVVSRHP